MLDWSVEQTEHPVAIRVPMYGLNSTGLEDTTDYSILNKFKVISKGEKVAILGLGNFFGLAKEVEEALDFNATLINPLFMTGLDIELLEELKKTTLLLSLSKTASLMAVLEKKSQRFYGNSDMKVLNYGAKKEFTDRAPLDELYQRYHLTKEQIVDEIRACIS